jgi:hypothetical protein
MRHAAAELTAIPRRRLVPRRPVGEPDAAFARRRQVSRWNLDLSVPVAPLTAISSIVALFVMPLSAVVAVVLLLVPAAFALVVLFISERRRRREAEGRYCKGNVGLADHRYLHANDTTLALARGTAE